jgi:hypothetical protein
MLIYEIFQPGAVQKESLFELKATAPGVKIYDDPIVGTLTPDQIRHNILMLKQGKAELDWKDHLGQQIQDASNMLSYGVADKIAAYVDSLRHNTKYADELNKYRDITAAYGASDQAVNLRRGVKAATGYKIPKDINVGNMTPGDVVGAAAQAPVDLYLAAKAAAGAKGSIGKAVRGGVAPFVPGIALGQVAEPDEQPMAQQPPPAGGPPALDEAASAEQQAAIAIAMKKAHKKPKHGYRR